MWNTALEETVPGPPPVLALVWASSFGSELSQCSCVCQGVLRLSKKLLSLLITVVSWIVGSPSATLDVAISACFTSCVTMRTADGDFRIVSNASSRALSF